jgi:hypothetical protein
MYIPELYVDKKSQTLQGATERRGKVEPEKAGELSPKDGAKAGDAEGQI